MIAITVNFFLSHLKVKGSRAGHPHEDFHYCYFTGSSPQHKGHCEDLRKELGM